jgi:hypothetical protein
MGQWVEKAVDAFHDSRRHDGITKITKITRATKKITKKTRIVFFVIFVTFVIFVARPWPVSAKAAATLALSLSRAE